MTASILTFPGPWSDRDLLYWVGLIDRFTDEAAKRGYPPEDMDLIIRMSEIAHEKRGEKRKGGGSR